MSTPLVIPANIAEITAPLLLGTLWNWTLYGVLLVQTYVYGYNFPEDRTLLKLLVYAIFVIETLQTALTGADVYYWFVTGFGNMDHLESPHASGFDVPIIGSVVSIVVQFFFVYRIWRLSKKSAWLMCLIICIVSIVDATAAFSGGILAHVQKKWASGRSLKILALTWLSGNTLSDILITGSMLYYLRRHAGGAYFSNHALSRIVRLTVETNIMTTTVGIISLLMVAVFPKKNWYICPTDVIGKLYSNTLLVSLNNRISIREAPIRKAAVVAATPASTTPMSRMPPLASGVVHIELEKPEAAFGAESLEDGRSQRSGSFTGKVFNIA